MIRKNGFTVVEGLLVLVVVGILGFAGWYVWHTKQKNNDASALNTNSSTQPAVAPPQPVVSTKTYTDSAKVYSLKYPTDWIVSFESIGGGEGTKQLPDWTKVSRTIMLMPPGIPNNDSFARHVNVIVSPSDDELAVSHKTPADKFHTITKMKINGYEAYLDHLNYVGPSAAEKYTDDYYVLFHGNKAVTVSFRENYYHNTVTPIENWDDSKYLPDVKNIVNSVKFSG